MKELTIRLTHLQSGTTRKFNFRESPLEQILERDGFMTKFLNELPLGYSWGSSWKNYNSTELRMHYRDQLSDLPVTWHIRQMGKKDHRKIMEMQLAPAFGIMLDHYKVLDLIEDDFDVIERFHAGLKDVTRKILANSASLSGLKDKGTVFEIEITEGAIMKEPEPQEPEPQKSEPKKKPFKQQSMSGSGDLQTVIIQAIMDNLDVEAIAGQVDVSGEISRQVDEKINSIKRVNIEVKNPLGTVKKVGVQHEKFETLLKLLSLRKNVMLVGASGSGKTHAVHSASDALDLDYQAMSVNPQTTKVDLFGYMDANGHYVSTPFRKAFENGGVFLLDEIDAGSPDVMTALNAATSNGVASFPDGMVKKHENFTCVGCANTYGRGADRQYVGRSQMDAATLNRFLIVEWDYDEKLEDQIASVPQWTKIVQESRKVVADQKIRMIISPRASIDGGDLIKAGFNPMEVFHMTVLKGVEEETASIILSKVEGKIRSLVVK